MINKLIAYLKGTRSELKRVNWPKKKQIINSTLLVVGFSLAVAFLLGFFDMFFTYLLNKFII